MSMFQELFQLALGATLSLTISVDEKQGRMTVNVIPKPKADAGEPALSTPLTLTASPEEFDAEFVGVLNRYRTARVSLAEQAQITQELLDAAKAASAKKGTTAVAKASAKPAPAPASSKPASPTRNIGADDDTDTDSPNADGPEPTPGAAALVATTQSQATEPQLFG